MLNPHRWRIARSVRRFAREVRPKALLDVGSGRSPYATWFGAPRVVRVDVEHRSAADVLGDAHRLPFRDASFDAVLLTEVIEHLERPAAAICELGRVLRPGGALVLTWPLLWGRHEEVDHGRFTRFSMQRILERNGFDVVRIDARGGIFTASVALLAHAPFEMASGAPLGGLTRIAVFLSHLLLLPLFALAWLLDHTDRRKEFSLGYQSLSRKNGAPDPVAGRPAT